MKGNLRCTLLLTI
jgi:hypothetical protein